MPDPSHTSADETARLIERLAADHEPELIELRRDLHAHPELSWHERRTTEVVAGMLERAGWRVTLTDPTGLVADLDAGVGGVRDGGGCVALRADLDALPLHEVSGEPFASTVPGVAHACGHDVHTTAVVGAGLVLAELGRQGRLPGRVRLFAQPAEEVMPGGAHLMIDRGHLADVERVFALHCEPSVDVGHVGLRTGALTSAADKLEVRLSGSGGHTSRPHLTGDLTFALAKVITELPAVMSRRMDPRAGVSVVWGQVEAGSALNVIPDHGRAAGTVRILDAVAWAGCEQVVRAAVADVVRPYGVSAEVEYLQGVPPVVNDATSVGLLAGAATAALGPTAAVSVPQSLGGEDFGWYLEQVPGAMVRLGTRTPGGPTYDLHQGNLRIDERAIGIGARLLAGAVHAALQVTAR